VSGFQGKHKLRPFKKKNKALLSIFFTTWWQKAKPFLLHNKWFQERASFKNHCLFFSSFFSNIFFLVIFMIVFGIHLQVKKMN